MTVTLPRASVPSSDDLIVVKSRRYAIYVAVALLTLAIVALIISTQYPVASDDFGAVTTLPP